MRIMTMTKRIIKQIAGDKRSLALLIIAPAFVLFLMSVILDSNIDKPNLETYNLPSALYDSMKEEANVAEVSDRDAALERLKNRETDGFLELNDNNLTIHLEGSETSVSAAVIQKVSKALSTYAKTLMSDNPMLSNLKLKTIETETVFINGSSDMSSFDSIAPMMMGFFIFFFVFLLAGVAFLRERISGTLERLVATPIKRIEIVLGYFFGFGIFAAAQTLLIQLFMSYVLNITIKGNPFLLLLINFLLAAGSLSLGTLLSAFAKNEFQLFQFIPVVIIPQVFFSGILPLREAPEWVLVLSKIFPLTYGADALTGVVLRGEVFSDVAVDILIITGYAVLFLILNSFALKKYRRL